MSSNPKPQGWEYFQNLKNEWALIRVHLKEQYPQLTDADLEYVAGEEEALVERLERKLSKTREEVERLLQDISLSAPKTGSPKPDAER